MNLALALLAAAAVLVAFAARRPAPARVRALLPTPAPWRPPNLDPRLVRLGPAAVVTLLAAFVLPLLAPIAGIATWALPILRDRRRRRATTGAVRAALPEVVDLLGLAVGAGLTVPLAVAAVGRRLDGPVGAELRRVTAEIADGSRAADALEAAGARLGEAARPIVDALVASDRYGAPLADVLVRLSAEQRADLRRRAEEAARRVPVKLLFPLVVCILPAFALLIVAPLIASGLRSLRL